MEGMDPSEAGSFGRVHPLPKLILTLLFLVLVTSVPKYRLDLVLAMAVYLWIYVMASYLSVKPCFKQLKVLFGMLFLIGLANPVFDRAAAFSIGKIVISYGVISMLTLYLKGVLAVIFSWLLVKTTGMEGILEAFSCLHLPGLLITVIMLIFRYISVLLEEASRLWTAYHLRAPGQKGVHYKVWGSFIGSLLIRSMDRAEVVYQSMEMRGFSEQSWKRRKTRVDAKSLLFLAGFASLMLLIRFVPVFSLVGDMVTGGKTI